MNFEGCEGTQMVFQLFSNSVFSVGVMVAVTFNYWHLNTRGPVLKCNYCDLYLWLSDIYKLKKNELFYWIWGNHFMTFEGFGSNEVSQTRAPEVQLARTRWENMIISEGLLTRNFEWMNNFYSSITFSKKRRYLLKGLYLKKVIIACLLHCYHAVFPDVYFPGEQHKKCTQRLKQKVW